MMLAQDDAAYMGTLFDDENCPGSLLRLTYINSIRMTYRCSKGLR